MKHTRNEIIIYVQITFDEYLEKLKAAEERKTKEKRIFMNRTFTAKEESIDFRGLNFLCVYGNHINGGYVAILNWGVSVELSNRKSDIGYNCRKILEAFGRSFYKSWLPQDEEAQKDFVYEFAKIITDRIAK